MIGLYLHIPFCRTKCPYCDFNSLAGAEAQIPAYLEALDREMSLRAPGADALATVYIGGGTPTVLGGERLSRLLQDIARYFTVAADAEITVEANPGTVDADLLNRLRAAGGNRLSLGAQSFDDAALRALGRIHTAAQALEAVALARRAGFDNISLDLIYGAPGQSLPSWRRTVETACDLGIEHVSAYALTIEPGTPLARQVEAGEVEPIPEDLCLEMMHTAGAQLPRAGLPRYEISNFARPGRECRHNLRYWRSQDYLGIGAGAHSYLDGVRWANVASPPAYAAFLASAHLPVAWAERLSRRRRAQEALMLALRTAEGAPLSALETPGERDSPARYRNALQDLVARGLVKVAAGRVGLTEAGVALADDVLLRLMP